MERTQFAERCVEVAESRDFSFYNSLIVGIFTIALSAFGWLIWDAAVTTNRDRVNKLEAQLSDLNTRLLDATPQQLAIEARLGSLEASREVVVDQVERLQNEIGGAASVAYVDRLKIDLDRIQAEFPSLVDSGKLKENFSSSGVGYIWLGAVNQRGQFTLKSFVYKNGDRYLKTWSAMRPGESFIYNAEASVRMRVPKETEFWPEVPVIGNLEPDTSFQLLEKPVRRSRLGESNQFNMYAKILVEP